MKILILGIDGMIGHKIAQSLNNNFDVIGSLRKDINSQSLGLKNCSLFKRDFLVDNFISFFNKISPDVIINCVGITIRRGVSKNFLNTKFLNQQFPHEINNWVSKNNKKLIHLSTDCVFDGIKGNYIDDEKPNANDIYGLTKSKGEINNDKALTIRCSMVGREIFNHTELFEWLYSMKNKKIQGYTNVLYSGVTTVWMGRVIYKLLSENIDLNGIYNIASKPISKYQLLSKLARAFKLNVNIVPNPNIKSNKILNSRKFTEITGINTPDWDDLIEEFKNDCDKYCSLYKK